MNDITVSVIIPVYNSENTVSRCLDSLLAQTIFDKIEVILINDGSKDGTKSILEQYRMKHPDQIVVIDQNNSGPAAARNNGLRVARGEYIGFVDSDDYVEPEMYETMIKRMTDDIDMVMCGRFNTFENGEVLIKYNNLDYDGTCISDNPKLLSKISTFVWDKLYRKEVIDKHNLSFPEQYHYAEDFFFLERYILSGARVAVVGLPFYHYHLNTPGSITGKCSRKWLDIVKVLTDINDICIANDLFEEYKKDLLYSAAAFYCRRVRTLKGYSNKIMQMIFVAKFHKFFKKYYDGQWKKVVRNHKVEEARIERTHLVKMIWYILK